MMGFFGTKRRLFVGSAMGSALLTWLFYFLQVFPEFLANLVATLIGVAVGVPVALKIARKTEEERNRQKQRDKEAEKKIRVQKILSLVREELQQNQASLERVHQKSWSDSPVYRELFPGIKVELWSSLSDSGELKWIDDLELIDAIASAYHYNKAVLSREQVYLHPILLNEAYYQGALGTRIGEQIQEEIRAIRHTTLLLTRKALDEIDYRLTEP